MEEMLPFLSRMAIPIAIWTSLMTLVPAAGQPAGGSVAGRVQDDSGVLPGTTVTIGRGAWTAHESTDAKGEYLIQGIPEGSYTVWFSLPGFLTAAHERVIVRAGSRTRVDARLEVSGTCDDCTPPTRPRVPTQVRFETTLGGFTIELVIRAGSAPLTGANFLKYVDGGFYDNGRFHRATRADNYVVNLPNRPLLEVVQAGIDSDKRPQAFPPIPLERTSVTGIKHVTGIVSMARSAEADTATSDFFILLNDQPSLDFGGKRFDDEQGAAAFGRVVDGMDVVRKIQQQPTKGQNLEPPIAIVTARRVQP
jgi:peptidyl-prolyl cis-trans isomerase A (cyclophilin A)